MTILFLLLNLYNGNYLINTRFANMKYANHKTILTIVFLINTTLGSNFYSQNDIWLNKNESENYTARHECSFVQAGDAFIMFGGREKAKQLDTYDFKADTWYLGGEAPKEFNHFQATSYEGFVWVIGSFKTNTFPKEEPADFIWLYYPPTKTWIKGPEIPKYRRRGGAGLAIHNGKFYIVGGNTIGHDGGYVNWFDVYDPVLNTWNILDDAPNARDHFSAVVTNDKLYALGGRQSGGEGGVFAPLVAEVDVFDFKLKSWFNLNQPLPTPRAAPAVALFNNQLFVIGGEGEKKGPAYNSVEAYDLNTNHWNKKEDMHYPRHGTQAIVSGKGIYVAAGSPNRGGGRQHNMEVYNKDKPKGKPLIASKLKAPKKIKIAPNSVKSILLKPEKGNTGIYISEISIQGDTTQLDIKSNTAQQLIPRHKHTVLDLLYSGNAKTLRAEIIIRYNGNCTETILVTSK